MPTIICDIILGKYWRKNTTHKYRYDALGIIDYMIKYAESSVKNKLVVIDVGCSKAAATRFTKTKLEEHEVKTFMVGIDNSVKVAELAEKNLDEFILDDVMNVDKYFERADVVICSKAIFYTDGDIRSKVLKRCTEFLKNDGVLITDVKGYKKSIEDRGFESLELSEPTQIYRYSFRESWNVRRFGSYRKDTKMLGKNDALEYSKQIKCEWDSMSALNRRIRSFVNTKTWALPW